MIMKQYFVYFMSNDAQTLYIGVTNDLKKRVWQHQNDLVEGFTKRYSLHNLVYFEETPDVISAIEREKQLKRWNRSKKLQLIQKQNFDLHDISKDIYL